MTPVVPEKLVMGRRIAGIAAGRLMTSRTIHLAVPPLTDNPDFMQFGQINSAAAPIQFHKSRGPSKSHM
jgi:hypothetical protein